MSTCNAGNCSDATKLHMRLPVRSCPTQEWINHEVAVHEKGRVLTHTQTHTRCECDNKNESGEVACLSSYTQDLDAISERCPGGFLSKR